jgi:hypothetical protein
MRLVSLASGYTTRSPWVIRTPAMVEAAARTPAPCDRGLRALAPDFALGLVFTQSFE